MRIFSWRCWLRRLWHDLTLPIPLSGHEMQNVIPDGVTTINKYDEFRALVSISRCMDCGRLNIGWRSE